MIDVKVESKMFEEAATNSFPCHVWRRSLFEAVDRVIKVSQTSFDDRRSGEIGVVEPMEARSCARDELVIFLVGSRHVPDRPRKDDDDERCEDDQPNTNGKVEWAGNDVRDEVYCGQRSQEEDRAQGARLTKTEEQ